MKNKNTIEVTASSRMTTADYGDFDIHVYKNFATEKENVVLVKGDVVDKESVLCRVASECLPGTVFHYVGCECREQIDTSLKKISDEGKGVFIYLRQEGRGQGLTVKIRAMQNKNKGKDTFKAVELMGLKADVREYWEAAFILKDLKVKSIRLLSNNPEKKADLEREGILIDQIIPVEIPATDHTRKHLLAKKRKGHLLTIS